MSQTLVALELELEPSISIATPPFVDRTLVQAAPKPSDELGRDVLVPQSINSEPQFLPHGRSIIVIAALTGINFLSSMSSGLLTVGLPRMAADVKLPAHLLLWYASTLLIVSSHPALLIGFQERGTSTDWRADVLTGLLRYMGNTPIVPLHSNESIN